MAGVWRIMLGPGLAPSPEAMREAHLVLVLRGLGAGGSVA
jgi:hypothetical protein